MPHYIDLKDFVAVLTPHFLQQSVSRNMPQKQFTERLIRTAFERAKTFLVGKVGFEFGPGYVYCRAEYCPRRLRWELTFISYTPAQHFVTQANNVTKFVKVCA